jgi:hypothetical protein
MKRIVLLLVAVIALATAGPGSLIVARDMTEIGPAISGRVPSPLYFGRVGRYVLLADEPGAAGERVALDQTRNTYVVYLHKPGIESDVAAIAPVLVRDGRTYLMQLDNAERRAAVLAGCELFQLPDQPIPLPAARPRQYPRALLPDTGIQRLVNRVSIDSVARHMQRLVGFQTRYTGTDSCHSAERFVRDYFTALGLDSVVLDPYVPETDTFYNVVGMRRGTTNPDELVIVCGHMDDESEDHLNYAPGAEDNASGTAMAMEAARVLAGENFGASVMFIAFTGEEQGLRGSFSFCQRLAQAGREVIGALNFDMIAWPGGEFGVAIHCDSFSQSLGDYEARMAAEYTTLDCSVDDEYHGTDHLSFNHFGYAATAGEEYGSFYPWYHTTADTLGNCDFPLAAEVAKVGVATAAALASAPAHPAAFSLRDAGIGATLRANWLPSPSPHIAGYKLLWGTAPLDYSDSALLGITTSHNIPGLVNGTRYYSTCVTIDSAGHEGFPAPEQSAIPGTVPLAPTGLAVMPIPWGNGLTWRASPEVDLAGYNVYRSTLPGSGFSRLNGSLVTDNAWRDSGLLSDTMYYYYVTAVDTQTFEGDTSAHGRGKPITLDHGILLVDETRDGNGTPGMPSDAQQDAFYHYCMSGATFTDWDVSQRGALPLAADIGPYSTIVWHADDYTWMQVRNVLPDLAYYLGYGGRLWYSGWKSLAGILPPNAVFPVEFDPGTFGHDWLSIAVAGESPTSNFIGAAGANGYPGVTCDSAKMYANQHGRLAGADIGYPLDAEVIMTFNSNVADTFQDKPVGLRWFGGPGKAIWLGFPLYYMKDGEARAVARQILGDLGEPYAIAENPAGAVERLALDVAPNPARGKVRVFGSTPLNVAATLTISDIAGRTVRRSVVTAGDFDIPIDLGPVASGVYVLRLSAGTGSVTRKLAVSR